MTAFTESNVDGTPKFWRDPKYGFNAPNCT